MADDYRQELQQKIDAANAAEKEMAEVRLKVSRQNYQDLIDAYRFLRSAGPNEKSIGQRLERLAVRLRDALDQVRK